VDIPYILHPLEKRTYLMATYYSKLVLDKNVRNPEGNASSTILLNQKVIPKGTVFIRVEHDVSPEFLKNIPDTPENRRRYGSGYLYVHPNMWPPHQVDKHYVYKYQGKFYNTLVAASHVEPDTLADLAAYWYADSTKQSLFKLLGNVLEATLSSQSNIPRLMGLDPKLDAYLRELLTRGPSPENATKPATSNNNKT